MKELVLPQPTGFHSSIGLAIGAGVASALAALSVIAPGIFSVILTYFSAMPLLLVGFSGGPRHAIVATVSGIVLIIISQLVLRISFQAGEQQTDGTDLGGLFFMTMTTLYVSFTAVPAIIFSALWHRGRNNVASAPMPPFEPPFKPPFEPTPLGYALALISCLGAVYMGMIFLWAMLLLEDSIGLFEVVYRTLMQFFDALMSMQGSGQGAMSIDPAHIATSLRDLASKLPGLMGFVWVVMLTINALGAKFILRKLEASAHTDATVAPPSARIQFKALALPAWCDWFLIGAILATLITGGDVRYMMQNMALVLATPFFFLGLSTVHVAAERVASPRLMLAVFYMALFFLQWVLVLVAVLGMAEQWYGIKRRIAPAS